jgi:hypothetical protein
MDIAFHDTYYNKILFENENPLYYLVGLFSINIKNFISEKSESELIDYLEKFFVGLLEGDGTITVDFIHNLSKRVRIFIALKNSENNKFMLDLLAKYIGGRVSIERNSTFVT